MKILRIKISNLNSLYGDVPMIDFEKPPFRNAGLFAIVGDTGAGKTTILDAITLAIYGRVHRFKRENVEAIVSYSAKQASAKVEFEARGKKYRAEWAMETRIKRDKTTEAKVSRTFSDITSSDEGTILSTKISEIERLVVAASGLTFEQFTKSVLLAQGDFAAFLRADEKERSGLLEQITGTEIYTELGRKAFEQHKNYRQTLEIKQAEWRILKLLTAEEIADLMLKTAELKATQAENIGKERIFEQNLSVWKNYAAVEAQYTQLQTAKNNLAVAELAFETAKKQLQLHEQAQPFQGVLSEFDFITNEINTLNTEAENLEKQAFAAENRVKTATEALAATSEILVQAQTDFQLQNEKIAAARQLDTQLAERAAPLALWQTTFDTAKKNHENAQKTQLILAKNAKANEAKINILQNSIAQNDYLPLANELKTIEFGINAGANVYKKRESQKIEYEKKVRKIKEIQIEIQTTETKLNAAQTQFETIEKDLQTFAQSAYFTQADFFDKENKIRQKIKYANDLSALNAAYAPILETAESQKIDLEIAQNTLNVHYRKIILYHDEEAYYHGTVAFRTQQLNALRAVQSHEAARAQLKKGEPCPLCGALEHPFADEKITDENIQRAENELLTANEKLKAHQEKQKTCEGIINRTIPIIENLEDRIYETRREIMRCEMEFGQILGLLGGDTNLRNNAILLTQKKDWETELSTISTQKNVFIKTKENWQKTQNEIFSKKSDLELLSVRFATENAALEQITAEGKQNRLILDEQTAIIEAAFVKSNLNIAFDWVKADAIVADLQQKVAYYTTQKTDLATLLQAQEIATVELKNSVTNLDKLHEIYTELSLQGETLKTAFSALQQQRNDCLPNTTTDAAQAAAERLLQAAQQQNEAKKQDFTAAEQQRATQSELRKQQQKRSAAAQQKQKTLQEKIEIQLLENDFFETITQIKSALLSAKQVSDFSTQQQQLLSEKAVLESKTQALLSEKANLAQATKNLIAEADLQEQLSILKTQIAENQSNITVIEYQLQEDKTRKLSAETLQNDLENLKITTRRWSNLNVLIGDATGTKFRNFAQSLTLQRLVVLANEHLKDLNPRYKIRKDERANLEILVQDTYQANFERSMQTLSGGESFLVSLALALGLSDMAGSNTRIESLFIDEGFGTLDAESLNAALSALESLQSKGKLIGIISHVPELKERITAKINVTKQGTGRSIVKL